MTNQIGPVDAGTFMRTSSLFDRKKQVLPSQAIRDLAKDIVHRVSTLNHSRRKDVTEAIPEAHIAAFCDILVNPSSDKALAFILHLQEQGLEHSVIRNCYLAGAARLLGDRWDADEISLLEVIQGTGHLYSLLRALRLDAGPEAASRLRRRSALFALVPGETHRFGIQLATETFRDAGWNIDLQVGLHHDDLILHAVRTQPTIIGLSLSAEERLADLVRLVVALRLERPGAIIGVAPAMNMEDSVLRSVVDIDLVFRDAGSAEQDLDWMLRLNA